VPTWITIAIGIVAGLLWRRFAATHLFGAFTHALLGITGAFAGCWLMDILRQTGLNFGRSEWLFVACGAVLLLWIFYGFQRRSDHIHELRPSGSPRQEQAPAKKEASHSDSNETRRSAA
jgi:uncharacterized membrane protein YeaQ/YmgE (transglycosylase-associated protein family)